MSDFFFEMKAFIALVLLAVICAVEAANDRPIIGILDQDFVDGSKRTFIAASYVKWVESGGARVVPLFYEKWSADEMISMLKNINGVLLPGGGVKMTGKYYDQLQVVFNYAKQSNDNGVYFPIWGSCLGVCSFFLLFLFLFVLVYGCLRVCVC